MINNDIIIPISSLLKNLHFGVEQKHSHGKGEMCLNNEY